jgi:oxygen-independent coproporphyrinogen-3 oxidase
LPPERCPDSQNPALAAGLYVHVPFCLRKCPYCDFASVAAPERVPDYLQAFGRELTLLENPPAAFDSLYIGGGTPSLLRPAELERLLERVHQRFRILPGAEVTLEANPDDVDLERLRAWRALGINRLSLGIQALRDDLLRFLGRRHDAAAALEALDLARQAGFENIGVDLIHTIPGQRLEDWESDLRRLLQRRPEHVSCYQLTIAPGTPLGRQRDRSEIRELDEELQRAFFLRTSERLQGAGYQHYEISNFAREETFRCRHNLKYWRHEPYIGLGPAAHSFQNNQRWWNLPGIDAYVGRLAHHRLPVAGRETLAEEQLHLERLFLGFRTREGLPRSLLEQTPAAGGMLRRLVSEGLLVPDGERIRPTPAGWAVADRLPLAFVQHA